MSRSASTSKQAAKPKRRWLQFSLRTLLLMITVFCVWLGLRVEEARRARAIQVVLAGQPALVETLCRPELRVLQQRLAVRACLQPLPVEEAADYLEEQVAERFPGMSEWQVDSREVHGVRGLRILWGWGPSWLHLLQAFSRQSLPHPGPRGAPAISISSRKRRL